MYWRSKPKISFLSLKIPHAKQVQDVFLLFWDTIYILNACCLNFFIYWIRIICLKPHKSNIVQVSDAFISNISIFSKYYLLWNCTNLQDQGMKIPGKVQELLQPLPEMIQKDRAVPLPSPPGCYWGTQMQMNCHSLKFHILQDHPTMKKVCSIINKSFYCFLNIFIWFNL